MNGFEKIKMASQLVEEEAALSNSSYIPIQTIESLKRKEPTVERYNNNVFWGGWGLCFFSFITFVAFVFSYYYKNLAVIWGISLTISLILGIFYLCEYFDRKDYLVDYKDDLDVLKKSGVDKKDVNKYVSDTESSLSNLNKKIQKIQKGMVMSDFKDAIKKYDLLNENEFSLLEKWTAKYKSVNKEERRKRLKKSILEEELFEEETILNN